MLIPMFSFTCTLILRALMIKKPIIPNKRRTKVMETIVVIYDVCNRLTDCLSSLTPITNKVIKYYLQIVLKITIRSYKNSAFYSKKQ